MHLIGCLKNLKTIKNKEAYVALTRAKEFLHVSSANEHYINGVKKKLRPSVFMQEIKLDKENQVLI